jgi:hypothetical protein
LIEGHPKARDLARALYHAPFALLSHGTERDPLFNYANLAAQRLWEMDWDALVGMPSRESAETPLQAERSQALERALREGFVTGYSGVRISSSGRRFRILDGIIWNLSDPRGRPRGQAARFRGWTYL